ncbi:hypothetical protein [Pectobacterium aquaticum]|uniref:Uncharacterized protein n=2 Tax=Pectobacterium TaxID=122277 RepID=A0AA93ALI0_9GAMM|nr:hypothetical protein [Pectobacterium aquaticum]PLY38211.1 hypothetical protein F164LOC_06225 [Pectobacterium carotovorum]RRN89570.1 hypothetical protein DMB79_019725 [Pectobacterium aquaticum]RRO02555.1 hypothetical protein DMB85_020175 [Pectobacterium aquaticum]RRO05035.1 hypothetical protein DMB83_001825 [Pectobacterium aquaticum]RRO16360.1 hypothetical protein DMB84_015680 [Pectobacterium aquaticum]
MNNQIQFYAKNELQPTSDEFKKVVASLTEAASHLHNQRKEEAIAVVTAMTDDVTYLHTQTIQGELLYKEEQKKVTERVASIILQTGKLNEEMVQINTQISALEVDIKKGDVNIQELQQHLDNLSHNLSNSERERNEHQRQLDRLNDSSVGSIFASIFSLGLDRAFLGIKSLVDQDAARISILRDEIKNYQNALREDENKLRVARDLQVKLHEQQKHHESNIRYLEKQVDGLRQEEHNIRAKLAAFTQIAGFYGKLKVVCESVTENITWILDIIDDLNDDQPRIVDIDASGLELVPLRSALTSLDRLLSTDKVQQTIAANEALILA